MKLKPAVMFFTLGIFSPCTIAGSDEAPRVIIKDYSFIPQEITIRRGQTITWENQEKRQYHSVWFEALGEEQPDYFFPEETYEREFKETGTFHYRCGPHPKMKATVIVVD